MVPANQDRFLVGRMTTQESVGLNIDSVPFNTSRCSLMRASHVMEVKFKQSDINRICHNIKSDLCHSNIFKMFVCLQNVPV